MRKTILIGGFAAIGGFVFAQQPPNILTQEIPQLKQEAIHNLSKMNRNAALAHFPDENTRVHK